MSPQLPRPYPEGDLDPPPLPRGRHRLPFEVVVANQRRRLLAGTAQGLARLLAVRTYLEDGDALRAQQRWLRRFGERLRHAAAECPEAVLPPIFLEPYLIGAVRFQIARRLLAFCLAPQEVGRIARAAAADGDGFRG